MDTESEFRKVNGVLKSRRPRRRRVSDLESELTVFLNNAAKPAQRNISVPQAFEQLIGPEIFANCSIISIKAGVLKVAVRPGPYMFQLKNMTDKIITTLQQQCRPAKISQIKINLLK